MQERYEENRRRISKGVAVALSTTYLSPDERSLIEMVTRGQRSTVTVGTDVVGALSRSEILLPAVLTGGDQNAPGWRDIEKRIELPFPSRREPALEREIRVTEYDLTEPGLPYMYDIGGRISLKAIRENGITDYNRWELSWDPNYPEYYVTPQVSTVTPKLASPARFGGRGNVGTPLPAEQKVRPKAPKRSTPQVEIPLLPVAPKVETPFLAGRPEAEHISLREGEVWHPAHGVGRLLNGDDGQPLKDDQGRLFAIFTDPYELQIRIPESLIGKTYQIGTSNPNKTDPTKNEI